MEGRSLPWIEVKKALGLDPSAVFNIEPAKIKVLEKGKLKTKTQSTGTKKELRGSQTVERLRRILGEKWDALGSQAQREVVGEIISIRDWVHERRTQPAALRRMNLFKRKPYGPNQVTFTDAEAARLATVELPEGYLNVSLRAAKRILPHMLNDCVYSEACQRAGFDHAQPEGELPTLDRLPAPSERDIPHAIVRTSVQSAVRVLNALWSNGKRTMKRNASASPRTSWPLACGPRATTSPKSAFGRNWAATLSPMSPTWSSPASRT
jgi:hypothetical protein